MSFTKPLPSYHASKQLTNAPSYFGLNEVDASFSDHTVYAAIHKLPYQP